MVVTGAAATGSVMRCLSEGSGRAYGLWVAPRRSCIVVEGIRYRYAFHTVYFGGHVPVSAWVLRVHDTVDVESEQRFILRRCHPACNLIGANQRLPRAIIDKIRTAHHEKLVVILNWRKSVECVTAVALEITAFRRRREKQAVKISAHDRRANGMQPRPAVPPNGREERQPDAELIQQL